MQWLIDGHNLIGQMPNLRLDDPNDEAKLVTYLQSFRARTGQRLTVIFDAGQTYRPAETKKVGGVTVQFAPHGQSADQIIKGRLRRVKNPQEIIVVTSDRAVQAAARQARVRVLTSGEFARQLLPASPEAADEDRGSQTEIKLSADEIDEWLKLFNNQTKP
ncbi:MAG TPA: NYN domain-containing protein [Anaerolineae bacterium]|nr:NYN domain-containing protein [Anaerolineae bacterium]